MKGYVINLEKDRNRLRSAKEVLKGVGVEMVRVPAINGIILPGNNTLSAAENGCYHSHVLALQMFLAGGDPHGIIFEDDVQTDLTRSEFEKQQEVALRHLPSMGMIYLGKCFCACGSFEKLEGTLFRTKGSLCLHAYMVSREGAKNLLKLVENKIPTDPIDLVYYDQAHKGTLKTGAFHPSLFTQDVTTHTSNLRSTRAAKFNVSNECEAFYHGVPMRSRIRHLWYKFWWVGIILFLIISWWWLKT